MGGWGLGGKYLTSGNWGIAINKANGKQEKCVWCFVEVQGIEKYKIYQLKAKEERFVQRRMC